MPATDHILCYGSKFYRKYTNENIGCNHCHIVLDSPECKFFKEYLCCGKGSYLKEVKLCNLLHYNK